jgi:hypothetical protein
MGSTEPDRCMEGRLYVYTTSPAPLQAFESGPRLKRGLWTTPALASGNFLVVMGGLTDGLLPTSYTPALAAAAAEAGWSTVQPVLRGSYCQFGTGGLRAGAVKSRLLCTSHTCILYPLCIHG